VRKPVLLFSSLSLLVYHDVASTLRWWPNNDSYYQPCSHCTPLRPLYTFDGANFTFTLYLTIPIRRCEDHSLIHLTSHPSRCCIHAPSVPRQRFVSSIPAAIDTNYTLYLTIPLDGAKTSLLRSSHPSHFSYIDVASMLCSSWLNLPVFARDPYLRHSLR